MRKLAKVYRFSAKALSLEGQGTAQIDTSVRFEAGQFYLTDLRHDDIAFVYSEESSEKLETFGAAIERNLRDSLADATESGDPDRITGAATANAYYETQLRNDAIAVLDDFLKDLPVYDLRKAGGMLYVAGLALDDFQVSADGIAVHLSAQTLVRNLAIYVLPILALLSFVVGPFIQRAIDESGSVEPTP